MINIITNENTSILELEVGESLNEQDYEKMQPELEKKIEEFGHVDLLIRMDSVPKMSMGAVLKDIKLGFKHFTDYGKVALVGDCDKLEKLIKVEAIIPGIEGKCFDSEDLDKAWNWLKEG
ncbi:MAG: STAS/SEC14 domain-containing protein [Bacillaceae bacterium]|nr:STAS/SEC14 domain-containing protein [Bacillaceae bacterium]